MARKYAITVSMLRALGGFRLPGERYKYAFPGTVPEGWLEVFGLVRPRAGTPYIRWRAGPASPAALRLARRWREGDYCDGGE